MSVAQTKYQIYGVPVIQYGHTSTNNAWVGGFNNPVFSPIDLNQDGLMDLFIYDKAAWKSLSFINTGSVGHPSFTYAPEYDGMYPSALHDWAVMRDYNHDGIADIFTLHDNDGMTVYRGYRNGNQLSYAIEDSLLLFPFGQFSVNIWTFTDNMPIIMDIDGDGALDIIAPDINACTLDYCRNIQIDSGYSADTLAFVLQDQEWGQFYEDANDCNVTLHAICGDGPPVPHRDLRHQGGACWGTHLRRNSNVVSAMIADIYCDNVKLVVNNGTPLLADMTSVDTLFPSYDVPAYMSLFPGTYGIDADNDGFEDLFVAPFASNGNVPSQSIDRNVIHYYHNNGGTDTINTYHYEGDTLLNNSVVDVGTESHPVFFDYNGDGLMDIVIGEFGQFVSPGNAALATSGVSIASLYLYENVGTPTSPIFQLIDTDWNHLSVYDSTGLYNGMYPAFGDLDGDGLPDMVLGNFSGNIGFFHNSGTSGAPDYHAMTGPNWFGINVGNDAAPFIYDVNGDGLNDLLIGSSGRQGGDSATIHYYWNFGTATHPRFSPDSVNHFFGKIEVWDPEYGVVVEGFANPFMMKENGQTVIYSGSQRGKTFKYAVNPDSVRNGTFTLLDSNVLGSNPGFRSNVSIADINNDGKNDYLTGNIRGGIMLFSDAAWSSGSTDGIADISPAVDEFTVYPNPAKDQVTCRLGAEPLASVQIYDMMGSLLPAHIIHSGDDGIVLSVSTLAAGIYIIQATDRHGNIYQHKTAIVK
jgi:hypothetical protein